MKVMIRTVPAKDLNRFLTVKTNRPSIVDPSKENTCIYQYTLSICVQNYPEEKTTLISLLIHSYTYTKMYMQTRNYTQSITTSQVGCIVSFLHYTVYHYIYVYIKIGGYNNNIVILVIFYCLQEITYGPLAITCIRINRQSYKKRAWFICIMSL